jgi:hypothetical protein
MESSQFTPPAAASGFDSFAQEQSTAATAIAKQTKMLFAAGLDIMKHPSTEATKRDFKEQGWNGKY